MSFEDMKQKAKAFAQSLSTDAQSDIKTIRDTVKNELPKITRKFFMEENKPIVGYRFRSISQPHDWVLCDVKAYEALKRNPDFEFEELVVR